MKVIRKHFEQILPDNQEIFLGMLVGSLESVDELSSLQISRLSSCYHFRLAPSQAIYINPLIKEITDFHNKIGIKVDFSKSIKSTSVIVFKINLDN